MNKIIKKILPISIAMSLSFITMSMSSSDGIKARAASINDENYSLLSTAIDASDTNTFEDNKNPQIFNSDSDEFRAAVQTRKDVDTYASSIEAKSAYEFSQKYSKTFSSSLETSVNVEYVATDISGKFDTNVNTESWGQQIETYEYYYWYAQKYIVNMDWNNPGLSSALSASFSRELNNVNSISSAKQLLRKYGSHVYETYVLGGKLEITKYFTQDASYELSESEKNVKTSLNVIVGTAKEDARASGSVNLSKYESNSTTSSRYYSKISYHAFGGDVNGAVTAADLFQYKDQWASSTASGFLYEAWTNSFNKDDVALKVVSATNPVAVWDVLDKTIYKDQIGFMKKAFDNMCYESYAEKCNNFGLKCDFISSLTYSSKGSNITISPYTNNIYLPPSTTISINLSDLITKEFTTSEYYLKLSSDSAATLSGNTLTTKDDNDHIIGKSFKIELFINDLSVYNLTVTIKKESFSGGYGTSQQPYIINTKADLDSVLKGDGDLFNVENHYRLSNDIDMEGEKIDTGGSGIKSSFKGHFDGDGYSIKNVTIKSSSLDNNYMYIGLFGKNEGIIKNLILDNVRCLTDGLILLGNSSISLSCGILTGYNSGVISNVQIKNSSIRIATKIEKSTSEVNVGGIAGYSEGLIEYSAVTHSNIYGIATNGKGTVNVGGITGELAGAQITQCYINTSKINASNEGKTKFNMGGLVGSMMTITAEDTSMLNPKLSMCLAYDIEKNKDGQTFGYIAGVQTGAEFTNCFYKASKEQSVAGNPWSGCFRKDSIKLSSLPSNFYDNWIDGSDGPILIMHTK